MKSLTFGMVALAVAASLPAAPVAAQPKNELIKTLLPPRAPVTRSLKIEPRQPSADSEKDRPKVSLMIEFEHGSDRLSPGGRKQLDDLGAALQAPSLASFRFLIAGHTDGAGGEAYNQQLSERRAAAVKAYLVGQGKIDEARLTTAGFGKSRPVNPTNPLSPENRRVEIINLLN